MPHTYEELKKKTIAELRELAKDLRHEAVQGYTQMNKEHLLPALCTAYGIDSHGHHTAALAEKAALKHHLQELRAARLRAADVGDHQRLHELRREYHHLNHQLRQASKRTTMH